MNFLTYSINWKAYEKMPYGIFYTHMDCIGALHPITLRVSRAQRSSDPLRVQNFGQASTASPVAARPGMRE